MTMAGHGRPRLPGAERLLCSRAPRAPRLIAHKTTSKGPGESRRLRGERNASCWFAFPCGDLSAREAIRRETTRAALGVAPQRVRVRSGSKRRTRHAA